MRLVRPDPATGVWSEFGVIEPSDPVERANFGTSISITGDLMAIGAVGESGTPESVIAPGTEMHLHAEVRVEDSFLGAGLDIVEVRALYARLFGSEEPSQAGAE